MSSLPSNLLRWFRKHGRDLPWRKTNNSYPILVSEMMLQQTQVKRALEFYPRFLSAFPNWKSLAAASNAQVIAVWSGLGYNRRALMLRDIARQVVEYGEPKNEEEWIALKGIGPYTSAALAAFTTGGKTMPIDTNIRRVLGRALLGKTFPDAGSDEAIRSRSKLLFSKTNSFQDVPQALFDLATTVCTKNPNCASCPLRNECLAAKKFLAGKVKIPKAAVKKANETRHTDKPHPDRIYRGRILKYVLDHPGATQTSISKEIDPTFKITTDTAWFNAMIDRLIRDGILMKKRTRLFVADESS